MDLYYRRNVGIISGQFLSDFRRNKNGRHLVTGDKFCAIAYSCKDNKDCNKANNRTSHDYDISLSGQNKDGSFYLQSESNNSTIPVKLTLKGVAGDATEGVNKDLFGGIHTIEGKSGYPFCRNNEFVIIAEINANDLVDINHDNYEGEFDIVATKNIPGSAERLRAEDDFDVELDLPPSILISGLEDMELTYTEGDNVRDFQNFCVYTSGKNKFQIMGESEAGKGSFQLSNGKDLINYELTVGRVKGGSGNSKDLEEEGVYYYHSSWNGAKDLTCSKEGENMRLTLEIQENEISNKSTGIYKDTVYLTVTPR